MSTRSGIVAIAFVTGLALTAAGCRGSAQTPSNSGTSNADDLPGRDGQAASRPVADLATDTGTATHRYVLPGPGSRVTGWKGNPAVGDNPDLGSLGVDTTVR